MGKILNLTQHEATEAQRAEGVFEPGPETKALIKRLLTFDAPPHPAEIRARAQQLADVAREVFAARRVPDGQREAMIGGAPYLMSALEAALWSRGIGPVYAFSRREVVEETRSDGSVVKRTVFRHLGFVRKG